MIKKIALSIMGLSLFSFGVNAQANSEVLVQADQLLSLFSAPAAAPAVSAGSPVGYGSSWGTAFAGVSVTNESQDSSQADGSMVVGMGLGDAHKYVGVDVSASIISINTTDGGFGDDGNFNLKVSRFVTDSMAVAVGGDNLGAWGEAKDNNESYYGAISNRFNLSSSEENGFSLPLTLSLGYGNGTYQSDASDDDDVANTFGVFTSAALQLNDRLSVIADWTGEMVNAGISFVPMKKLPISASLTATDLSNRTGNKVPLSLSVGYAYSFK